MLIEYLLSVAERSSIRFRLLVLDAAATVSSPARLRNWRLVTIAMARSENDAMPPAAIIASTSGRSEPLTVRPSA